MTKKLSLADALHEASGKKSVGLPEKTTIHLDKAQPSSRMGKKIISGHFDPIVNRQLKQMALDHNTTIQNLLTESLNDLFIKYKMKPLA